MPVYHIPRIHIRQSVFERFGASYLVARCYGADRRAQSVDVAHSMGSRAAALVKDLNASPYQAGLFTQEVSKLTNVNGKLFFTAWDAINGTELGKAMAHPWAPRWSRTSFLVQKSRRRPT